MSIEIRDMVIVGFTGHPERSEEAHRAQLM